MTLVVLRPEGVHGFRVGVSKLLLQRALAEIASLDARIVAQRMSGPPADWIVECKYDGIRAQIVKRAGGVRPGAQRRAGAGVRTRLRGHHRSPRHKSDGRVRPRAPEA